MLSADVRLEGFTQSDWAKVLSLFRPRATPGKERDPERPRGGIIAIHEGGRLRKLLHTQAGRLRLEDARAEWPLSCEELAVRNHASWACKIESGALENLMDRFGACNAGPGVHGDTSSLSPEQLGDLVQYLESL